MARPSLLGSSSSLPTNHDSVKKWFWPLVGIICLFSILWLERLFIKQDTCSTCLPLPDLSQMLLPSSSPPTPADWGQLSPRQRLDDIHQRIQPGLETELQKHGFKLGAEAILRGFKESHELEVWLRSDLGWQLFRTYPIAALSGKLGPKLREGDGQTPEGLYGITPALMHPGSTYHLAMNIGYPNADDQKLERTGSFIMIHGSNVSIGCLAMTDPVIEEIYLIVEAALASGQKKVPVQLFPFRMTTERLAAAQNHPDHPFWLELKKLHDAPLQ